MPKALGEKCVSACPHLFCADVGFSYGLTEYSGYCFLVASEQEGTTEVRGGWGEGGKKSPCLSQRKQETQAARRSGRDVTAAARNCTYSQKNAAVFALP